MNIEIFFKQTRHEMNLYKKSSFDIFQDYDNNADKQVSMDEFIGTSNAKMMGLSVEAAKEIFTTISSTKPSGTFAG